jgi:aspartyl protease
VKTTLIAAVLIAAGSFAAAQESAYGPLPDIHFSQFKTAAAPFSAQPGQSSPLDVQIQNQMFNVGQIFVNCGFDGQGLNCLLDTGSNICLVKADDFFGKYPAQGQRCSEGASGAKVCSDLIDIADLKVGGIDFGAENALRRTPQSCGGEGGPQLPSYLVGSVWHSLLGHQVGFDFASKTLTVDPPQQAPGAQQPMKLVLDNNYLEIPVAFGSAAPVQMLYDTGAGLTVMDQSFVDANASAFSFLADTQIQDSSCQKIPVKIYSVNSLSIAGNSLSGTYAVAMDLSFIKKALGQDLQGIIGFNAITSFNWRVDLKNDTFSVAPNGSASIASVKPKSVPSVLKFRLPSLLQGIR